MTDEMMTSPIMMDNDEQNLNSNQILVTWISWNKETFGKYKSRKDFSDKLPSQISLTIPDNIMELKDQADFYDRIETFVYNLLKSRFNHEAYHCQIWLPLPENA